jgi:hypothetical protein
MDAFNASAIAGDPSWAGHPSDAAWCYGGGIAVIFNAIACFLLSRSDRPAKLSALASLHRFSLRLLPILPIFSLVPTMWLLHENGFLRTSLSDTASVLALLLVLLPALTFLRLRTLAVRLGRRRLANQLGLVSIGYGVAIGALLVAATQWEYKTLSTAPFRFDLTVGIPWAIVGLFALWAIGLLVVTSVSFFRSSAQARTNWRRADVKMA